MSQSTQVPNPVIRAQRLARHPGWTLREYKDGTFDAAHDDGGLSPQEFTREHAMFFVEHGEPKMYDAGERERLEAAHAVRAAATCPFHADRAQVRNGMCGECAEKADDAR